MIAAYIELLRDEFESQGFTIQNPSEYDKKTWDKVRIDAKFEPYGYSLGVIDYYSHYFTSKEVLDLNISLLILKGNTPLAIWPIIIRKNGDGSTSICSGQGNLLPPLLNRFLTYQQEKDLLKTSFKAAQKLATFSNVKTWNATSSTYSNLRMNEWDTQALCIANTISH